MAKSYPRTRFEIVDQTNIQEITQNAVSTPIPIAMAVYTSDKGPEEWRLIRGLNNFTSQVGPISFVKHGQPQLTVAEELRAGGAVFCKRLVDPEATLANTTVYAKVVKVDGVSYVYYYTKSIEGVKTFEEVCAAGDKAIADASEDSVDVPLFSVTPMGRGASNMSFRINPEYTTAKSVTCIRYSFEVYENQQLIESILFTMNPDIITDGVSQFMNPKIKANSVQVKVNAYEEGFRKFIYALAETAVKVNENDETEKYRVRDLVNVDFINAKTNDGKSNIGGIITTAQSDDENDLWTKNKPSDITIKNPSSGNGITLDNGTYGDLGSSPMTNFNSRYNALLLGVFGARTTDGPDDKQGKDITSLFDQIIYDLDAYKIDFICDCGYSFEVKKAITNMIDFRGDMVFLADLGTEKVYNIKDIISLAASAPSSKFIALYHNIFEVYDPYTSKQIKVTMPFLLAPKIINHISGGAGRPFAGMLYNITFPEIIDRSINFLPVEIPGENQKQKLIDANVNYISYYDGTPVMETMYTNSSNYSQLSYLHNIMAIQEIIKIIRTRCPRTRYTFMDGNDLERYINDASAIVNQYNTAFKSISIQYMADEKYEQNNIFYATIKVQFKNFVNEEYFKVIAIS